VDQRRRRLRIASLVCGGLVFCAFAALFFVPRSDRFTLLNVTVTPLLVLGIVLLVLSQPTRLESGQTDLSRPSPRGRIGVSFLVLTVLFVALLVIQH
jgi:peptidoglycan/LPS O-acetylase OafA/YrhL